ncbi:multiple monosaccharide ABC transporter permease [Caproiciproducens galactitolivorans]|uniref:Xylose transport system permease protein XylH n=1 Tax=Caproiciproducens galactitolivorans TaxID=642589 RepID=A0ABT4BSS8_9FIRM|nr:multiple monosaccharide ABC transporter permease [Caproiciproducens galactitolivorans]MCY1713956.1 sugar ABC transporter permease [Caproiciproducens galactitolivorans]
MANLTEKSKKSSLNIRQYSMLVALVVIMALFQVLTNGILLKPQNVTNLILQNSYVIVLAVGMLLCIVSSGAIDLSVGSVVAFIGALLGVMIVQHGMNVWLAIVIALLVGALIGVWQGFWIAYVRIPAFIVTLAGMMIFRGLTQYVLQGMTLTPFPKEFLAITSGFLPNIGGGELNLTAFLLGAACIVIYILSEIKKLQSKKKRGFSLPSAGAFWGKIVLVAAAIALFTIWLAFYKGIPILLVILLILVVVYSFYTSKTVPGRHLYAMGGNEKAAVLSGINTKKALFYTFVNMGVLAALGGIVFTSRLQAATPTAGQGFEMDAIAACYIGGASAMGGSGTIVGAVIGALVMGVLNNGLSIMGVGSDITQTIKGLVLLAAVIFDVVSKKKAEQA